MQVPPRASHVNTGTSTRRPLPEPPDGAPVLRPPAARLDAASGITTAHGGLVVTSRLVERLRIADDINASLKLLKAHRPFHESDHVLTQALNLYVGGEHIEDIAELQHSEAVRRMLGAARLPDPTTTGDFLRRFEDEDLAALDEALDRTSERAWQQRWGDRRQPLAFVDLDSTRKPVYGHKKGGADFSYKGVWSYHPSLMTLAQTGEVLRLSNRPGSAHDAVGVAAQVEQVLPMLQRRFVDVVVRGDSQFPNAELMNAIDEHDALFLFVGRETSSLKSLAQGVLEAKWKGRGSEPEHASRDVGA